VIITTNHKTDGIYLEPDDRRHYVAWSDRAARQSGCEDSVNLDEKECRRMRDGRRA
jgi:hypothetical protein